MTENTIDTIARYKREKEEDMNDIQKAIDESLGYCNVVGDKVYGFRPSELKSLLEQVAKEQRKDEWLGSDFPPSDSKPLVTENLTFNED